MLTDPQARASLLTSRVLKVVSSIDNLVVIAGRLGKLPKERQVQAQGPPLLNRERSPSSGTFAHQGGRHA